MIYSLVKKIVIFIAVNIPIAVFIALIGNALDINTSEHGPLELLQLAILSLGFMVGAATLYRLYKSKHTNLDSVISWMLWMISIVIIGRETSWGSEYALPDSVSDQVELVAIIVLGGGVLSIALSWLMWEKHKWQFILEALRLPITPIFIAAASFVLIGDFFEKKYYGFAFNELLEEVYECLGYITFLFGYGLHARTFFTK